MNCSRTFAITIAVALGCAALDGALASAQSPSKLTGRWILNRGSSQFPEVGFGADWVTDNGGAANAGPGGGGSRRGGGGGGGAAAFPARRESEDDARRVKLLTAEVRNPPTLLTITETPATVSVADERGHSRLFRPDGKESAIQLDDLPVAVTAKRQAGRLVVLYHVEEGRELRYTYARTDQPPRLTVDVEFLERGGHDAVRRVYDAASEADALRIASAPPSADTAGPASPDSTRDVQRLPAAASPPGPPPPAFAQQPDAELKGLTALGVVVEDLSPQAAMCGLKSEAIDAIVSKSLTDAGLKITGHSDEDSYVYVTVLTSVVSTGVCVSRYDAFLYTHTTARLSYGQSPVLIQVSLLHQGGMAGGATNGHADAVLRVVKEYVDQFAARIRAANK